MFRLGLSIRRLVREVGLPALIGGWAGTITVYVVVEAVSGGWGKTVAVAVGGAVGAIVGIGLALKGRLGKTEKIQATADDVSSSYSSLSDLIGYEMEAPVEFTGEDLLKLWALTKSLVEKLSSRPLETAVVIVSEEGVPEAVYPDDAPIFIDDEEDSYDVTAVLEEDWVIAVFPVEAAVTALNAIDDGVVRIKSEEELYVLYMLAKRLAYALGQRPDIAAYSAYKALLKLANEGVIELGEDMARLLPLEPEDVRRRVREQVGLEDTLRA